MSDVNLQDRLGQMQEAWTGTAASSGGGGMPPDGVYQARIARFDFVESNLDKALQLKTELDISHGDHQGRTVSTWHDLEDEERLGYTKGYLALLGVDVANLQLAELPDQLEPLGDLPVEIRIKTKRQGDKEYKNVYVNKVLAQAPLENPPTSSGGATDSDDDIPF